MSSSAGVVKLSADLESYFNVSSTNCIINQATGANDKDFSS